MHTTTKPRVFTYIPISQAHDPSKVLVVDCSPSKKQISITHHKVMMHLCDLGCDLSDDVHVRILRLHATHAHSVTHGPHKHGRAACRHQSIFHDVTRACTAQSSPDWLTATK